LPSNSGEGATQAKYLPSLALKRLKTKQTLFVVLLLLGFVLRIGYGVARYQGQLNISGDAFVSFWDYDGLEHVLIAKALLSGKGYVVDDTRLAVGKHADHVGQEALFKAPLYEFFLAGCFAISGFSFKLFFPLQALLGGLTAGLAGLITLQAFEKMDAAWLAGMVVALHPILVNSASQPYNENVFFFLFAASIASLLVWWRRLHTSWALICGASIGPCMLTRENGLLLLASAGALVLIFRSHGHRTWVGYGLIMLTAFAIVAPWTIRNYVRFGVFVPVASIVGEDLSEGNNECVAKEGMFVAYWAEGRCAAVDEQRDNLARTIAFDPRMPAAVRDDRISRRLALEFISAHPGSYAKLVFRRLWTTLLPFDPRGNQRLTERIVLSVYWLGLYPAGICGVLLAARRLDAPRALLILLGLLNLLSMAAVLYWSDLRFRVALDIPLACLAGFAYSELFRRGARWWFIRNSPNCNHSVTQAT
jgi:hypothetical protein